MGGIFGEGIDLVGERLIGAVVVGVGVPQVCLERDLIKDYFDRQNDSGFAKAGFAYAYQYQVLSRCCGNNGVIAEADRGSLY
jgi:DNA excision repair protein ERCC-2